MLNWVKKKILKSIINDIIKELPTYREKAIELIKIHKDDILAKVKEAIKDAVIAFVKSKIG